MFQRYLRPAALALLVAIGGLGAIPAQAATSVVSGTVVHVSASNIKVTDATGKTQSFLMLPRFRKIFKSDGKTTVALATIHAGSHVRVYYDQKALGARHADRILVDTAPLKPVHG